MIHFFPYYQDNWWMWYAADRFVSKEEKIGTKPRFVTAEALKLFVILLMVAWSWQYLKETLVFVGCKNEPPCLIPKQKLFNIKLLLIDQCVSYVWLWIWVCQLPAAICAMALCQLTWQLWRRTSTRRSKRLIMASCWHGSGSDILIQSCTNQRLLSIFASSCNLNKLPTWNNFWQIEITLC